MAAKGLVSVCLISLLKHNLTSLKHSKTKHTLSQYPLPSEVWQSQELWGHLKTKNKKSFIKRVGMITNFGNKAIGCSCCFYMQTCYKKRKISSLTFQYLFFFFCSSMYGGYMTWWLGALLSIDISKYFLPDLSPVARKSVVWIL